MGLVAYLNINKCSQLLADVSADIEQASEAERVGQYFPLEHLDSPLIIAIFRPQVYS